MIEHLTHEPQSFIMKRHLIILFVILGLFAFPQHAMANAGTPLMWAGMLHLVFGNALIGLGEGLLLAVIFRVSKLKSVLVMIAANYFSAWIGYLCIIGPIVRKLPLDLYNARHWFWIMVGVTYLMTLVLEWPFIARCLKGSQNWLRRSIVAVLVTQTASYVLLFGWYWMASGTSLYTKMNVVKPADISLPESVLVYFIEPTDGNVYTSHLSGVDRQKVYEVHSTNRNDRLLTRPNAANTNYWDLIARLETDNDDKPILVEVITNLQVEATCDWRTIHSKPQEYYGTIFSFGEVQKLGSATNSHWEFRSGFWSRDGLRAKNEATSHSMRLSYETPFGAWMVRNAVHLPSDKVLFQLGDDQICIFDPETRKVALLWHGRGPVPVIEKRGVTE